MAAYNDDDDDAKTINFLYQKSAFFTYNETCERITHRLQFIS